MVRGSWFVVRGSWFVVRGSCISVILVGVILRFWAAAVNKACSLQGNQEKTGHFPIMAWRTPRIFAGLAREN